MFIYINDSSEDWITFDALTKFDPFSPLLYLIYGCGKSEMGGLVRRFYGQKNVHLVNFYNQNLH